MADSADSVVDSAQHKDEEEKISKAEEKIESNADKDNGKDSEDQKDNSSRPQTPNSVKSNQDTAAFSTPNIGGVQNDDTQTTPRTPIISTPPGTPYSYTTSENNTPTTSTPNTSTPNTPKNKMPHRWGINWKKGEKLEAMDYMNKWYLAKIKDLDYKEHKVLIHFEGWNSRFDEWFTADSERMRPVTRSSGRPQKKKIDGEYNIGEKVLAKWSDSKMYAAHIEAANNDGSFSVKFEDGFKKNCLPSHIKPFPESPHPKKRPDYKEIKPPGQLDTPKSSKRPTTPILKTPEALSLSSKRKDNSASKPKGKLIVAGSFLVKRERSAGETTPKIKTEKPRDTPVKIKKELEETPVKIKKESDKSFKIKREKDLKKEKDPEKVKFFEKVKIKKENKSQKKLLTKSAEKRRHSLSPKVNISPIENKLAALKKSQKKGFSTTTVILSPEDCGVSAAKRAKISDKPNTAPKEFVVEADHNPFKCNAPNCGKSFRKGSLLDSHIKFYHNTSETKPHSMSAPRKRRKTSSICSSDSDHSVTAKGKSPLDPKRKRHVSMDIGLEVTIPPTPEIDLTGDDDAKPLPGTDLNLSPPLVPVSTPRSSRSLSQEPVKCEEAEETTEDAGDPEDAGEEEEEEEEDDDVAHCACGYHFEDGLMIQCEVCLSWQHAACFNITENSLPKKYICYVCLNPPGVRDSKKYIHEQDWLKQGALPVFNFLPGKVSSVRTEEMQQTQDLAAEIHKLSATLHALKTQLNAIRQKNHPAVKLWQTNWDDLPRDQHDTSQMDEYISMDTASPSTSAGPSGQLLNYLNYSAFLAQVAEGKEVTDLNCEDSSTDSVVSNRSVLLDEDDSNPRLPETSGSTSQAVEPALDAETGLLKGGLPEDESGPSTSGGDPLTRAREKMEAAILEKCEKNMLQHILRVQSEINSRLDSMEDKLIVLEAKEGLSGNEDLPPAAPRLKRAVRNNIRDVQKLKVMSELCGTKPRKQH